ncbi:hypothetical protein CEXT_17311 [Caerostris extrusa]|uniref:C2H2-type domain-containing protein n=1 Tax=Caerostris extrusa TaxID=172846 RepID=A0AAV4Y5V2_CAEEX|nr:hypothetical protein CEXT_17311 [Caerostris extrusa]
MNPTMLSLHLICEWMKDISHVTGSLTVATAMCSASILHSMRLKRQLIRWSVMILLDTLNAGVRIGCFFNFVHFASFIKKFPNKLKSHQFNQHTNLYKLNISDKIILYNLKPFWKSTGLWKPMNSMDRSENGVENENPLGHVEETDEEENFDEPEDSESQWWDHYEIVCKICGDTLDPSLIRNHMEQIHFLYALKPREDNYSFCHNPMKIIQITYPMVL